jgi:hypothetical protein
MFCDECGQERPAAHPPAFSTEHKNEESRARLAALARTPMSMPITVMRKQPAPQPARRPMSLTPAQQEARAAVLDDRKTPRRATYVDAGYRILADLECRGGIQGAQTPAQRERMRKINEAVAQVEKRRDLTG